MNKEAYHVCATCIHFHAEKAKKGMNYFCKRLGYETRPNYQFNCWTPKKHVQELIDKRMEEKKE
ncbi:hypothetical protein [Cytobacillus praedii]|uniref:Uncharacterized protein n=1 Tax=Cytobacillus praedii TaxID=1742358 RepID=A0A4R1AY08_9BACI|nr:hypothetical protein [Cytobacillus praedii]MED3553561.1 hypothetical protein [Cytobacillus praedii]TCJ05429.1 hypothetical protein E0Y62_04575 [Cytobacillus praedii]